MVLRVEAAGCRQPLRGRDEGALWRLPSLPGRPGKVLKNSRGFFNTLLDSGGFEGVGAFRFPYGELPADVLVEERRVG